MQKFIGFLRGLSLAREKQKETLNTDIMNSLQIRNSQHAQQTKMQERNEAMQVNEILRKTEIINRIINERPDIKNNPQALNALKQMKYMPLHFVEKLGEKHETRKEQKTVENWHKSATNQQKTEPKQEKKITGKNITKSAMVQKIISSTREIRPKQTLKAAVKQIEGKNTTRKNQQNKNLSSLYDLNNIIQRESENQEVKASQEKENYLQIQISKPKEGEEIKPPAIVSSGQAISNII